MQQTNFLPCQSRLPGHRWEDYAGSDWKPSFGTGLEWRCEVCGSIRRYIIDRNGFVTMRSYWHPTGYSWAKNEKPSNEELRLMAIRSKKRSARNPKVIPLQRKRGTSA